MIPLVSICIPTYNRASMLREAVTSALAQDYANLEVVVSDNASTDDTSKVVNEFNDPRIKYFRNSVNIGVFQNFSKAAYKYARGKYAMLLADDDYLIDNSYITKAVGLLEKNNKIVMVFANWRRILDKENLVDHIFHPPSSIMNGRWLLLNHGLKMPRDTNRNENNVMHIYLYSLLFKRELAIEIGMLDYDYLGIDIAIFGKLCCHGDVGFVDTVACVRREHKKCCTYTIKFSRWVNDLFKGTKSLVCYMRNVGLPGRLVNKFERRHLRLELRMIISKTISESMSGNREASLLKIVKMTYNQSPLFLTVFLRPRVIAQIVLSLNPPLYSFFRKRGSSHKSVQKWRFW